ncbi:nucleotidyltransferase domain-containing protein [Natronococcus sp. A-GB7]|uniref:nucleotidyltransferase domain-containing protein n=1 Tax=Natronococcus sp. A-GB7 TaxID=3037649 RepID=UPI00241D4C0C|nr:nucleotidyltransferase domain-containing protein [Natronococcus sp. A-GB7]MDG5821867.1 nucleotidyltransferase domain-containing protein [Natronococcus sp. A-GB7]
MSETTQQGIRVCIDIDAGDQKPLFRISAADDILHLLADAHETEFTIAELVDVTDVTRSTVWRAVDLLHEIGVVEIRETPQRNYITINRDRLEKDDPVLAIEQSEFQDPVRAFVEQVHEAVSESEEIEDLVGIIVFGSVARGEADRQSDIDLFVVIDGTRTTARRRVADVVSDLSEQRFDGDRFDFEPYVESVESAHRAGPKLREIFYEGITVYGSERLQSLRKEVFAHE